MLLRRRLMMAAGVVELDHDLIVVAVGNGSSVSVIAHSYISDGAADNITVTYTNTNGEQVEDMTATTIAGTAYTFTITDIMPQTILRIKGKQNDNKQGIRSLNAENKNIVSVDMANAINIDTFYARSNTSLLQVLYGDNVAMTSFTGISGCKNIEIDHIPKNVTTLPLGACNQAKLSTFTSWGDDCKITSIGNSALINSYIAVDCLPPRLVSATIAAIGSPNITALGVPASATNLAAGFFCPDNTKNNIETISVDSANPTYESVTNCIMRKSDRALLLGCVGSVIPNDTKKILDYAFWNCNRFANGGVLDLSTTHTQLAEIGNTAFCGCTGLALPKLPDSVTKIGNEAFRECTNLALTKLPDNLVTIGHSAFYKCIKISIETLPSTVTSVGQQAFYYCSAIKKMTIPSSIETISNAAFQNCGIETLTLNEGLKEIGRSAFFNCRQLVSTADNPFIIPSTVEKIGSTAFYNTGINYVKVLNAERMIASESYNTWMAFGERSSVTIYVPSSIADAYTSDTYWGRYTIIPYEV